MVRTHNLKLLRFFIRFIASSLVPFVWALARDDEESYI